MKVNLENSVDFLLKANKFDYIREFKFCESRQFRSDFGFPQHKILIEIEGGTWVKGAHVRGKHYSSDCEKYNLAATLGYYVLRYTTDMLRKNPNKVIEDLEEIISRKN